MLLINKEHCFYEATQNNAWAVYVYIYISLISYFYHEMFDIKWKCF